MIKNALCALVVTIVLSAIFPVSTMASGITLIVTGPTTMTPRVEQSVDIHVTVDSGTLENLTSITLKMYYDPDGGATSQAEFDSASVNTQTCAEITWVPSSFTLAEMGTTSWTLGAGGTPTLTNQSGDFIFVFTPGKVASEASGSAVWQLGATANDGSETKFGFDPTAPGMNLYQQLSFPGTPTFSWGAVQAGLGFGDPGSKAALNQTITIISNTSFKLNAQSTASWTSTGTPATLDPTGGTSFAQQFSIEADNATLPNNSALLGSSPTQIKAGTATDEAGTDYTTINVWLKLANSFAPATYNGTINFSVSK